jgi:hypothetical protein
MAAHQENAAKHECPNVLADRDHTLLKSIKLSTVRVEIDLNLFSFCQHPSATSRQETAGEFGQNDFFSANGLSSFPRIPSMR